MSKGVTIRGVDYATRAAAALALGVSRATISNAALDPAKLERVGLGPATGAEVAARNCRPVVFQGVSYASRGDAAAAHGVTRSQMSAVFKVLGQPAAAPVIIGGVEYASQHKAAAALGVTPADVRAWLKVQAKISA